MNQTGITKTPGLPVKQVMVFPALTVALSGIVGNTGIDANAEGKKIIPAGTPVGSASSILTNPQAVQIACNTAPLGATAQGVLQYDVDVTAGNQNASIVIAGYVNTTRSGVVPVAEVIAALNAKVTFLARA